MKRGRGMKRVSAAGGQPAPGADHGGFTVDDRVRFGFRVGTIYRFKMQRGRWFAVVQPDEPVLPVEVPVAELRHVEVTPDA